MRDTSLKQPRFGCSILEHKTALWHWCIGTFNAMKQNWLNVTSKVRGNTASLAIDLSSELSTCEFDEQSQVNENRIMTQTNAIQVTLQIPCRTKPRTKSPSMEGQNNRDGWLHACLICITEYNSQRTHAWGFACNVMGSGAIQCTQRGSMGWNSLPVKHFISCKNLRRWMGILKSALIDLTNKWSASDSEMVWFYSVPLHLWAKELL